MRLFGAFLLVTRTSFLLLISFILADTTVASAQNRSGALAPLSTSWVQINGREYCASPDRSVFFRHELVDEIVYLFVRTRSSEDVKYILLEERDEYHVFRRLDNTAVNFPIAIVSTQSLSGLDEVRFQDQKGRVLKSFPMRYTYSQTQAEVCR